MNEKLTYETALDKLIQRSHAAIGSVEGMSEQEEDSFLFKGACPKWWRPSAKWIVDSI